MGEHRISAAGDPFTSVMQREESSVEKLLYAYAGCGRILPRGKLVECVGGNHDNLHYYHGALVCGKCADLAGVER